MTRYVFAFCTTSVYAAIIRLNLRCFFIRYQTTTWINYV